MASANQYDEWVKDLEASERAAPVAEPLDQDETALDDEEKVLGDQIWFNEKVAVKARDLEIFEEARRHLRARQRADQPRPRLVRLDDFLARPLEDPTYRVEEVWPTGGRVVLAAQFKAGKTTLVGNVLRALADGDDLFDRFPVRPGAKIVLIDDELDDRMLQAWLADQGIKNQAAIRLVPLRGQLTTFDIRDPDLRAEWAADIAGADVVVLDCLRPMLDALNLDESHEAGKFLVPFDALLKESGASEALVLHHMGHSGERSRGDSRIQDWPDALWKLVRDKDDDDPTVDDLEGSRYFSAFGRGVTFPQAELDYDHTTRRLTIGARALTRRESTARRRTEQADQAVLASVAEHPGINKTKLRHDVRTRHGIGRNEDIDNAVDRLVQHGLIRRHKAGNTQQHYPGEERLTDLPAQDAQPAPGLPGHTGVNVPARPVGAGTYTDTPETHDTNCKHGVPNGHTPDHDFLNGRLTCPQCAQEATP